MIRSVDAARGGISRHLESFDRAAARLAAGTRPGGGADPTRDVVQMMVDGHAVAANRAVLRTADELVGTLIDIVA